MWRPKHTHVTITGVAKFAVEFSCGEKLELLVGSVTRLLYVQHEYTGTAVSVVAGALILEGTTGAGAGLAVRPPNSVHAYPHPWCLVHCMHETTHANSTTLSTTAVPPTRHVVVEQVLSIPRGRGRNNSSEQRQRQ